MPVSAYAAYSPKQALQPYQFEFEELKADEIEIEVMYCGLCHSDLSMLDNDWQQTQYPFVPGHEVIGCISKLGSTVTHLTLGQTVGLGWQSGNCRTCHPCLSAKSHLCKQSEATIVGRHGGFASHVRAQAPWVIPIPEDLDLKTAGPLLCGGLTVFSPLLQHGIQGIHHVAVIGIGGLGHIAVQLYKAWGCKVTAFSSNPAKFEELKKLGADQVLSSIHLNDIAPQSFDLIVDTVNQTLDWEAYIRLLAPEGKFHVVGLVEAPIQISSFQLIDQQISLTGSPTGTPLAMHQLLDFCARHHIQPWVEEFPVSKVNDAIEKLRQGELRYRAVLNMQELHV